MVSRRTEDNHHLFLHLDYHHRPCRQKVPAMMPTSQREPPSALSQELLEMVAMAVTMMMAVGTTMKVMVTMKVPKVTSSLMKLLAPLRRPIESERREEMGLLLVAMMALGAAEMITATTTRIRTRSQEEVSLAVNHLEVEVAAVAAMEAVMALAAMECMDRGSIVTS